MLQKSLPEILGAAVVAFLPAAAGTTETDPVKPMMQIDATVAGMPQGEEQQIRVMTAHFAPGDSTPFHSHRFPVTVYVVSGAFTLELADRAPIIVAAGEAYVEPPGVPMTGFNRSADMPLDVVIFYVSEPETPFLDPLSR